jgi:hypothetical protein
VTKCCYCGSAAKLVGGKAIYPHRPDLYHKKFYQCVPCKAYVGCHPNTDKPLGRLANAELRKAKMDAHRAFDPIWRNGPKSRSEAYAWLAKKLDIPGDECHIGMFDPAMCDEVVEVCTGVSLEEFRTGISHVDLGPEQRQQLWDLCRKWIKDNKVTCGETLYQVDSVQEAMYDLTTQICKLVGFHQED